MRVPFFKWDEDVVKRHAFLKFLINLAEIEINIRKNSDLSNSEPDHL